jgi:MGT family glycosyltransferase
MNCEDAEELRQTGINITELSGGNIEGAQPMAFTFPRVAKLTDTVIEACKGSDYIVYDFFAMEGYIAGKKLTIPTVCSVPAIMGPFNPNCLMLKESITRNAKYIEALESKYGLEITKNLEMVSDGFLLPSDYQNIQWSWPRFIRAKKFGEHRLVKNYHFMRPSLISAKTDNPLVDSLKQLKADKKIIYVSFGTVVTGNLWNNVPGTRQFVRNIFNNIKEKFGNKENYEVVVSTGRKTDDLFDTIPQNFHVCESVPQQEVLALADVFITHGGGNSVNEAIDAEKPMVVIPFFGDQHLCADNVAKLGIGITFAVDEAVKDAVVDTEACHLERASLADEDAISDAIKKILSSTEYNDCIKKIKSDSSVQFGTLAKLFSNDKVLGWKEGDLLYGCNDDREKLAALTGRTDFYRLCDMHSFSTLFADSKNRKSMPRIIDQYHDVLTNMTMAASELKDSKFDCYRDTLNEYESYIRPHLAKL